MTVYDTYIIDVQSANESKKVCICVDYASRPAVARPLEARVCSRKYRISEIAIDDR